MLRTFREGISNGLRMRCDTYMRARWISPYGC